MHTTTVCEIDALTYVTVNQDLTGANHFGFSSLRRKKILTEYNRKS